MTKQQRMAPEMRADQIVEAALGLIEAGAHYSRVTRDEIAERCNITGTAVQYHYPTMAQLRRAIMRAAVKRGSLRCIAQGLVDGDAQALKAPAEVRENALWHAARGKQ
jgi:AcrR family transcriptional regulator